MIGFPPLLDPPRPGVVLPDDPDGKSSGFGTGDCCSKMPGVTVGRI